MTRTVLYNLPPDVRGFVSKDADGETVFILNARLTHEMHLKTYQHEQEHVANNDFGNSCVDEVEYARHKK